MRNLKLAAQMWEGDQEDLAQIHNALGFGYLSTEKLDESVVEFKRAVELQVRHPGCPNPDPYQQTPPLKPDPYQQTPPLKPDSH